MKDGCKMTSEVFPLLKGCYFGKERDAEHTGLAFFRFCGQVREVRPFLVVDFVALKKSFDVDLDGKNIEVTPLNEQVIEVQAYDVKDLPNGGRLAVAGKMVNRTLPAGTVDPVPFIRQVNEYLGSCADTGNDL